MLSWPSWPMATGFQYLPLALTNVNALEKIFDRYYCMNVHSTKHSLNFAQKYSTIFGHCKTFNARVLLFLLLLSVFLAKESTVKRFKMATIIHFEIDISGKCPFKDKMIALNA